jgi:hypothetical protein
LIFARIVELVFCACWDDYYVACFDILFFVFVFTFTPNRLVSSFFFFFFSEFLQKSMNRERDGKWEKYNSYGNFQVAGRRKEEMREDKKRERRERKKKKKEKKKRRRRGKKERKKKKKK